MLMTVNNCTSLSGVSALLVVFKTGVTIEHPSFEAEADIWLI